MWPLNQTLSSSTGCPAHSLIAKPLVLPLILWLRDLVFWFYFYFHFRRKSWEGEGSQAEILHASKAHAWKWPGKTGILMTCSAFLAKHLPCARPMSLHLLGLDNAGLHGDLSGTHRGACGQTNGTLSWALLGHHGLPRNNWVNAVYWQVGTRGNDIRGSRSNKFPIYSHTLVRPGEMT